MVGSRGRWLPGPLASRRCGGRCSLGHARVTSRGSAPYGDFPHRVLILGGGFAGCTAARHLCKMIRGRDDVGVMLISRENYFTFWPMLAGCISSDIDTKNVAQPLRRALIRDGASFRRAEVESGDTERQVVAADWPLDIFFDQAVTQIRDRR